MDHGVWAEQGDVKEPAAPKYMVDSWESAPT